MGKETELSVIQHLYDLILWMTNHVVKFPKVHKYSLGERVLNELHDLLALLIQAKYARGGAKKPIIADANLKLEQIRYFVRLTKDLRCLSVKSYDFAAGCLLEIGREFGGWAKSTADR